MIRQFSNDGIASLRFTLTVLIALMITALAILFVNFGLNIWRPLIGEGPPSADTSPVEKIVAGRRFAVPRNMLRARGQVVGRVGLAVLWPSLSGYRPDLEKAFADQSNAGAVIKLDLVPRDEPVGPRERLERIYKPFMEGGAVPGPDGLTGFRLASGSGFGGQVVYVANGEDDPRMLRCTADDGTAAPATCFRSYALGDGIQVEYSFRAGLLNEWRSIDDALAALIAGLEKP